jgi:glycerophosphoryl diester phosphodiesterase
LRKRTQVWAHRGLSGRFPENTLPSFQAAIDAGADGIECDLHMTLDGEPVIMHDEEVSRTTSGFGDIGRMTYQEVRQLDAGSWYGSQFRGLHVPHLIDLLALLTMASRPLRLNIELKGAAGHYPGIEQKALQILQRFGYQPYTIFSSFHVSALEAMAKASSTIQLGWLFGIDVDFKENPQLLRRCSAIHLEFLGVSASLMNDAQRHQKRVNVYTVNHLEDVQHMEYMGVHAIITDVPDQVVQWVKR